ncbi:MAG TPA: hypothetical protein VMR52_10190 [Dehalococcoidia bacterium]|nr:hypothetical protein [Dehalococcoidia bacterium]
MTSIFSRPVVLLAAALVAVIAALFALAPTPSADAHPLGNFTINRYSRIEAYSDVIRVHYAFDMAEIPAFQERGDIDANSDGDISPAEAHTYANEQADAITANLSLTLDAQPAELSPVATRAQLFPGEGGLDTLRVDAVFETPTPPPARQPSPIATTTTQTASAGRRLSSCPSPALPSRAPRQAKTSPAPSPPTRTTCSPALSM